jgi:hypothetical protein
MKYYIKEHSDSEEDATELPDNLNEGHDPSTAENAADYGWNKNDLWEASWPLTIVLISESEKSRWVVDCQYKPVFYASRMKEGGPR